MNKRVCRSSTTKLDIIYRGLSLTTFVLSLILPFLKIQPKKSRNPTKKEKFLDPCSVDIFPFNDF